MDNLAYNLSVLNLVKAPFFAHSYKIAEGICEHFANKHREG